ncbi:hypothetical protein D3C87_1756510 [compost metagenome]
MPRDPGKGSKNEGIAPVIGWRQSKVDILAESFPIRTKPLIEIRQIDLVFGAGKIRHDRQHHLVTPFQKIPFFQNAGPLLRSQIAGTEEPAKIGPALPVLRIGKNIRRSVCKT